MPVRSRLAVRYSISHKRDTGKWVVVCVCVCVGVMGWDAILDDMAWRRVSLEREAKHVLRRPVFGGLRLCVIYDVVCLL